MSTIQPKKIVDPCADMEGDDEEKVFAAEL